MKPIWYFVGLILLTIGTIIFITGIYMLAAGTVNKSVLSNLHPDIWWGGIMMLAGFVFILKNRKVIVE